jgi:hypothetical protein
LYAKARIPRGSRVAPYTGRYLTQAEADVEPENDYILCQHGHCLDARHTNTDVARYINDPRPAGPGKPRGTTSARLSCSGARPETFKCRAMATRSIPPGKEILASYGPSYWRRRGQKEAGLPPERKYQRLLDEPEKEEEKESKYQELLDEPLDAPIDAPPPAPEPVAAPSTPTRLTTSDISSLISPRAPTTPTKTPPSYRLARTPGSILGPVIRLGPPRPERHVEFKTPEQFMFEKRTPYATDPSEDVTLSFSYTPPHRSRVPLKPAAPSPPEELLDEETESLILPDLPEEDEETESFEFPPLSPHGERVRVRLLKERQKIEKVAERKRKARQKLEAKRKRDEEVKRRMSGEKVMTVSEIRKQRIKNIQKKVKQKVQREEKKKKKVQQPLKPAMIPGRKMLRIPPRPFRLTPATPRKRSKFKPTVSPVKERPRLEKISLV